MGARVTFAAGKPRVENGPFRSEVETLGGYWIIEVKSKEEAIEWALRCPASAGDIIEIRQMQEPAEFPGDIQAEEAALAERIHNRRN